ncbi:DUF2285 domain-containing protein [Sphingobium boeckii]|uniref:T6SS Transcription factor RovC-like DNA binding domain-containing protein n=1 Tax=Sphingobium boeckii TaxID=1082345 RepID=A0A7W9AG66_9SPHN|nr:DUF2285 domain-containing protein [Sphingobium boeckii]MBB5685020.1 hypothetical protein [Sphingobium boeckii]
MHALPPGGGQGDITFDHADVVQVFCVAPSGAVFLELRGAQDRLWIALMSGEIRAGAFLPRFTIQHMPWLEPQMQSLKRLHSLVRTGALTGSALHRTGRGARLSLLLRAYDAQTDGASHQDFATVVFGAEAVGAAWNGASDFMRSRVKRMMRTARQLVAGGYRSLIG